MKTYIVLLRGINVGGKNKIAMSELKKHLEDAGFEDVKTYIQSGNVLLQSNLSARALGEKIEALLVKQFSVDGSIIKVLALTTEQLTSIITKKPSGFGDSPETYHSDVIFLMGITAAEAMEVFKPREGVDAVWAGDGVIYSQRLSAERTKSRLNRIMGTPAYQSMTIRNWNTTTKLLALAEQQ